MSALHDLLLLRGFFSPERLQQAGSLVSPDLMADQGHRTLAELLCLMYRTGEHIDTETVRVRLEVAGDPPHVAQDRLSEVMAEDCPSETHYASLVKGSALLTEKRKRAELATWLSGTEGSLASIEEVSRRLNDHTRIVGAITPAKSESFLAGIQRILKDGSRPQPYRLDFGPLDDRYLIYPHSYNVVLADSGIGKTSFMLNGALNLARQGVRSYIKSIEMDMDSLHCRIAGMACGVAVWKIDQGKMSPQEREQIEHTIRQNAQVFDLIDVAAPTSLSCEAVHGMMIKDLSEHGPGVMWIDYLQRVIGSARHLTNETSVQAHVSSTMTAAAKATGMPLMVLSQVTSNEGGMDRVKGSKQPKHDAWTMLELKWVDSQVTDTEAVIEAHLLKGRKRGASRKGVPLLYQLETQRIFYTDSIRINQ